MNIHRRTFLHGTAALGVCCACGAGVAMTGSERLIDVHYHIFPPEFIKRAPASAGILRANPAIANWDLSKTLDEMDRNGVAMNVLSFPLPSMWSLAAPDQRELARMNNDFFAALVSRHPQRFAMFAALPPLTDVQGCLDEIAYGLDKLKAVGVRVMTSYQDRWLGDPSFDPVWEELDRRAATVFVHPDIATCCVNLARLPFGYVELPLDTARAATSLWYADALSKWPRVKIILSHGGGALAMVADRVSQFGRPNPERGAPPLHDALEQFQNLYFDTANAASKPALGALRNLAKPEHVLFGTDAPFVDIGRQIDLLNSGGFTPTETAAIKRANAIALIPTLQRGLQ